MSTTIDQKVVEMRFDNAQFEKNVATTVGSVEKLKKSLDFTGMSKGLEDVETTARRFDMSPMGNAVETVRTKFSALEVMGVTALVNITNSAVNAGKRIVSALTIDPITTGFNEYELKMGSIQTMMAATGEDLETVNGYLDELNAYSDKTIYSFSDMTQNIGKFTNAGVSLKDSVAAIQGIANVAAVSGANSNEASRAMYNFAQALSSGYVKLIDWKSIELANMGTVEFKQQLIDAAVAAGTLKKSGDGMYKTLEGKTISATKGFNDSLQDQWMTSEVLINTLNKYSDTTTEIGKKATQAATEVKTLSQLYDTLKESAQSGWAQTWEIIVGDFEEAKQFMTYLSDTIGGMISASAEARNDMLENWKILGGRTALLESIKNIITAIGEAIKPVKEAFNEIFPPMTAERLVGFCEGLKNLTSRLIMGKDTADKVKRTFKGLFAVVDIVRQVFVGVVNAIRALFKPVGTLGGGLLSITATLGDLLVALNDFIKRTGVIPAVFEGIGVVIGWVVTLVGKFLSFIGKAFSGGPAQAIIDFLDRLSFSVSDAFKSMGDTIKNSSFYNILTGLIEMLKNIASVIIDVLGKALKTAFDAFGNGEGFAGFLDTLIGGGLGVLLGRLIYVLTDNIGTIKDVIAGGVGIVDSISEILDGVADVLSAFQNKLNAEALKTLASAILILSVAIIALTFVDKEKLADGLVAVTALLSELMVVIGIMTKSFGGGVKIRPAIANFIRIKTMAGLLTSVVSALILAIIPLYILGKMDMSTIKQGLISMGGILSLLLASLKVLSKIRTNGVLKQINLLRSIAFALLWMIIPLAILGNMETDTVKRGLVGIAGILTIMLATMRVLQDTKTTGANNLKHIAILTQIASALILMSIPMVVLGHLSWEQMTKGLVGIAALLTIMIKAMDILRTVKTNGVLRQITLLMDIAATLVIMSIPMVVIGMLSWEHIARGLVGMTGMLGILVGTLAILSKVKTNGVLRQITLLMEIVLALIVMTVPMVALALIGWDGVIRGLVGMIGMLGILVGALAILQKVKTTGVIKQITTLVTIAGAIALLAVPMVILGLMSWESMLQGLIGVGALMVGLTLVMAAMAQLTAMYGPGDMIKATTSIVIMAAALLILIPPLMMLAALDTDKMWQAVSGLLVIMAGLTLVIAGLALISETFAEGIVIGVGAIILMSTAVLILSGALAILALIPAAMIAGALLTLVSVFIVLGAAGAILATVSPVILILAASLLMMGTGLLAAGVGAILFGTGLTIIATGLLALSSSIAVLFKGLEVAASAIPTIVTAIVVGLIEGLGQGIVALIKVLADAIPALGEVVKKLVLTVCDILSQCVPVLVDVLLQVVQSTLEALASFIGPAVDAVFDFILAVLDSLNSYIGPIIDRVFEFVINILDAIASNLKPLAESIGNLIFSLFEAILSILSLMDTSGLAKALLNVGIMLEICLGLAALGVAAPLAMLGVLAFGQIVTQLIAVLAILGGIAQIPGLQWLINEGGDFLQTIGTAIGKFIGGILGGIGQGVAASLPAIGTSLSAFMDNVKNFIEGAKAIDDTALTGVENLIKMFLMITGTALLDSLLGVLGDAMVAKFVSELILLGMGLKTFSDIVAGMSKENIDIAAEAIITLSNATASLPKSGGIIQLVTGEHDLGKFALQLPLLGLGLKGFSDAVTGMDAASVTAATAALTDLAEMSSVIPQMGGLLGLITGNDDYQMATWAVQLPLLGTGLKGFANAVSGIDAESVTAAANAAKSLAEMTSILPDQGGVVAWLTGDTSIANFAFELVALGRALNAFSVATVGISPESVTAAANAAKALAEMTATIPNHGGIVSWFAGESSVSQFAGELPKLGNGLKGFSDSVAGINAESVTAAANAAKGIAEMTQSIPKEGGIKAWFTGETSISKFADKLPALGAGIKGFSDSVAGVNPDNITAAATAAKSLAEMTDTVPKKTDKIVTFGENLEKFGGHIASYFSKTSGVTAEAANTMTTVVDACNKFASVNAESIDSGVNAINKLIKVIKNASEISGDSVNGFTTALKNIAKVSVNSIVESFDKLGEKMKKVGKEAVKALAAGLSDNSSTATKAAKQLVTDCADAASEKSSSFETAGKNLVQGFADGISVNTYLATAKAKAMAKAAAEAAKEALDINSPSKVFRKIGSSVPEGFAQGVGKYGNVITASVEDMSGVAIDGVKDSLKRIADVINDDSYTQPTIRPVLDLSDVKYGVGQLNSMLGGSAAVAMTANVGAINSRMSSRSQNGNFDDLIKETKKMNNKLDKVGNTTYNVNGVTYDDGSVVATAVETLTHAVLVDGRR